MRESSGCGFLMIACWRHGMLKSSSESFVLVGANERRTGVRIPNSREDLSNSSSLKLILFPLFLARSSIIRPLLGLSSTSLKSMLFLRTPFRGVSPGSRRAWVNKLLRLSRAELEFVDELAHLGGGSKSDSRSEGSEGGGSWRSCVRDEDDVFGTWASSARSRAAGVSSVTAYTDGRDELTGSRGVASVSSLSSCNA